MRLQAGRVIALIWLRNGSRCDLMRGHSTFILITGGATARDAGCRHNPSSSLAATGSNVGCSEIKSSPVSSSELQLALQRVLVRARVSCLVSGLVLVLCCYRLPMAAILSARSISCMDTWVNKNIAPSFARMYFQHVAEGFSSIISLFLVNCFSDGIIIYLLLSTVSVSRLCQGPAPR